MSEILKERYTVPSDQTTDGKAHVFTLKATSKYNRRVATEMLTEYRKTLLEKAEAIRQNMVREQLLEMKEAGNEPDMEIPEYQEVEDQDDLDFYIEMFKYLADGPHELIDPDKFDIKIVEKAQADFLPSAYQTANRLMSF